MKKMMKKCAISWNYHKKSFFFCFQRILSIKMYIQRIYICRKEWEKRQLVCLARAILRNNKISWYWTKPTLMSIRRQINWFKKPFGDGSPTTLGSEIAILRACLIFHKTRNFFSNPCLVNQLILGKKSANLAD